jgi:hypothetical protein
MAAKKLKREEEKGIRWELSISFKGTPPVTELPTRHYFLMFPPPPNCTTG